ncbi:hypothetical protein ES703_55942 [subsurface metagenome]
MKRELFPAVVGDILDSLGLVHKFLPPQIRPLREDMVVVGRAMPVIEADHVVDPLEPEDGLKPFGKMFEALDDLKENEVYICTGASPTYALWGELMTTRAVKLRASGAVLNGYSRDTVGVLRLGFPTFSWGGYAQDQGVRGRVVDFRCSIEFPDEVRVDPGDIVFGALDGMLIIPRRCEEEVVRKALEKVQGENMVKKAIEAGMSAQEAFRTYGIM